MVWPIVYFFFVETQGPTFEELLLIFEDSAGQKKVLGNIDGKQEFLGEQEYRLGESKKGGSVGPCRIGFISILTNNSEFIL